jgi:hypothetical protein
LTLDDFRGFADGTLKPEELAAVATKVLLVEGDERVLELKLAPLPGVRR